MVRKFEISILVLFSACVLLAGCASHDNETEGAYSAEIAQLLDGNSSTFVKNVLADGNISDEEAEEARSKYISCLSENGYEAQVSTDQYGIKQVATVGDVPLQVEDKCSVDTRDVLSLYDRMRENPQNEDLDDVLAACFVRHDLVPKDFTGKDLKTLQADLPTYSTGDQCDKNAQDYYQCLEAQNAKINEKIANSEVPTIVLPGGRELNGDDPEISHCQADPQW
ncbi:hypothetical protein [uncultured Mobiluncus sp.]|uniref:hypothetical protein n=1 Tax=uncultured Mobiluncus sp. TaxID=293425 RepID=UPI002614A56D|nr:hypothetical protein [uncultured Mobiluncus sp.]